MTAIAIAGALAATVLGAWGVPALVLAALWPAIEDGHFTVRNYRGHSVPPALWIAFPAWAIAVVALRLSLYFFPIDVASVLGPSGIFRGLQALLPLSPMVTVALGAMVFGVIDDVWGGRDAKGFRGHVGSLAGGRMTTGGLKLLGIGVIAFIASVQVSLTEGLGVSGLSGPPVFAIAVTTLLGTLVIALSANTVNLADLRPGRALKVGFVLLTLALLSVLVLCVRDRVPAVGTTLAVGLAAVLLGGPLVAMWPYDVRERGMLGDGGANAIGALMGFAIFVGLAPAASRGTGAALAILGVVAGLLLLVNGLAERVSYSEVIERHAMLRRIDRLGRPDFEDESEEPDDDA